MAFGNLWGLLMTHLFFTLAIKLYSKHPRHSKGGYIIFMHIKTNKKTYPTSANDRPSYLRRRRRQG